jgi:hypothetical protein
MFSSMRAASSAFRNGNRPSDVWKKYRPAASRRYVIRQRERSRLAGHRTETGPGGLIVSMQIRQDQTQDPNQIVDVRLSGRPGHELGLSVWVEAELWWS